MIYKHFVITRFNIPFMRKENVEFLYDETYLTKRFEIFHKFTFNSLKNQSSQNFLWLVLFDHRTPNIFKKKNAQFQKEMSNFIPVYINIDSLYSEPFDKQYLKEAIRCASLANDGYKASNEFELKYEDFVSRVLIPQHINNLIRQFLDKDTQYVITTRIDNDDCFECNMIKNVQNVFSLANIDKIINFDNGLQYINGNKICQSFYYPNNHFTSIIESVLNPLKTIIYWEHFFIDKYKTVIHFSTQPLWLEILHDSNAINTLKIEPYNRLQWEIDLSNFGINIKWGWMKSFLSVILNPQKYIWQKIKVTFRLAELKNKIILR